MVSADGPELDYLAITLLWAIYQSYLTDLVVSQEKGVSSLVAHLKLFSKVNVQHKYMWLMVLRLYVVDADDSTTVALLKAFVPPVGV